VATRTLQSAARRCRFATFRRLTNQDVAKRRERAPICNVLVDRTPAPFNRKRFRQRRRCLDDARDTVMRPPAQTRKSITVDKDRRGATYVTPRRLREERVLHSPAEI
jgi:hypothetical protein